MTHGVTHRAVCACDCVPVTQLDAETFALKTQQLNTCVQRMWCGDVHLVHVGHDREMLEGLLRLPSHGPRGSLSPGRGRSAAGGWQPPCSKQGAFCTTNAKSAASHVMEFICHRRMILGSGTYSNSEVSIEMSQCTLKRRAALTPIYIGICGAHNIEER